MSTSTTALPGATIVSRHEPVMGTFLVLQITASSEDVAGAARDTALAEAARLEAAFTIFDPASELCRWRSGALDDPSPDLVGLLDLAARWQRSSRGAFNPLAGVLTARWQAAERQAAPPSAAELAALAASIAEPRFAVVDGRVIRTGDCSALDLNALAKGHVVDRITERVLAEHPVDRLVVNAGGDLVHCGVGAVRIAVEDPLRPVDGAPPLGHIEVAGAAVATSGSARRWFDVGGERHSRVLDPRTGWPVEHTVAATAIAADAASADVLATLASIADPHDPRAGSDLERLGARSVLVVAPDGARHSTPGWPATT